LRIEVGVPDEQVENIVDALSAGAEKSGGSGIAFVTELFDCIELRTGARGETLL
jgi:nitrogen regulatory protein PII